LKEKEGEKQERELNEGEKETTAKSRKKEIQK
jgi:hypothetical protein